VSWRVVLNERFFVMLPVPVPIERYVYNILWRMKREDSIVHKLFLIELQTANQLVWEDWL